MRSRDAALLLSYLALANCSNSVPDAAQSDNAVGKIVAPAPVTSMPGQLSIPQNTYDPAAFVPLQSAAVKGAIHAALRTGQTQRWQEGKLSGYAVPSQTPGANGCRTVRYTVDQRSGGNFESITACDASAR